MKLSDQFDSLASTVDQSADYLRVVQRHMTEWGVGTAYATGLAVVIRTLDTLRLELAMEAARHEDFGD